MAYALGLGIQKALAMAYVVLMPHTLTLIVWKKYALILCVWKAKCPGTHHPAGIRCSRCRP